MQINANFGIPNIVPITHNIVQMLKTKQKKTKSKPQILDKRVKIKQNKSIMTSSAMRNHIRLSHHQYHQGRLQPS
jgi:hypothetical protein